MHQYDDEVFLTNLNVKSVNPKFSLKNNNLLIYGFSWQSKCIFENYFEKNLNYKTLFLDLDLIIIDNIDCFFNYNENFSIIENWTQLGKGIGNSSVYCFEIGTEKCVDFTLNKRPVPQLSTYLHKIADNP